METPPSDDPLAAALAFYGTWIVQLQTETEGIYETILGARGEEEFAGFSTENNYSVLRFAVEENFAESSNTKSRVELRERGDNARALHWSQAGYHRLVASIRIPSDSLYDRKRDIIIMQAHTGDQLGPDPFDGRSSDSFGTGIYWRAEDEKFECRVRGNSGESHSNLLTGVSESERDSFNTFSIEVRDGESRCGYHNGNEWVYTSYSDLIGGMTYFKCGNYTQERTDASGDGGATVVMIQDLSLEHPTP